MIVEIVRYQVPSEELEGFIQAFQKAMVYMSHSPHCLSYEMLRGHEESNHFTFKIEWDSIEGHLQGFRKGPEWPPFLELVKPFTHALVEANHYCMIATKK